MRWPTIRLLVQPPQSRIRCTPLHSALRKIGRSPLETLLFRASFMFIVTQSAIRPIFPFCISYVSVFRTGIFAKTRVAIRRCDGRGKFRLSHHHGGNPRFRESLLLFSFSNDKSLWSINPSSTSERLHFPAIKHAI